jgi:hypothetical protein
VQLSRQLKSIPVKIFGIFAIAMPMAGLAASFLEFDQPTEGASYPAGTKIPLQLRAQSPDSVISSAEVFANGVSIGTVVYCCPFCPCPPPMDGMLITLQLPAPWDGTGTPPDVVWQGLRNLAPGTYRLTATANSSLGEPLDAPPVTITVLPVEELDLSLRVSLREDGSLAFVIRDGSLVPHGFDLWLSRDLKEWRRLGPFQPGAVAAFASDQPDPLDARPRFYRALPATQPGVIGE